MCILPLGPGGLGLEAFLVSEKGCLCVCVCVFSGGGGVVFCKENSTETPTGEPDGNLKPGPNKDLIHQHGGRAPKTEQRNTHPVTLLRWH